ncbi:MAG: hypothetical protein H6821_12740 [Planctomycetaceae bacterium]|nr:hypothetical protein [Planctomycetaceae bacterium]
MVAAHPALGGGKASVVGRRVWQPTPFRIEALLTNVVDGLPEVVRLGWLLTLLAMPLATFRSSESVEFVRLTQFTIEAELATRQIDTAVGRDIAANSACTVEDESGHQTSIGDHTCRVERLVGQYSVNESLALICGNSLLLHHITLRSRRSPQTPI